MLRVVNVANLLTLPLLLPLLLLRGERVRFFSSRLFFPRDETRPSSPESRSNIRSIRFHTSRMKRRTAFLRLPISYFTLGKISSGRNVNSNVTIHPPTFDRAVLITLFHATLSLSELYARLYIYIYTFFDSLFLGRGTRTEREKE